MKRIEIYIGLSVFALSAKSQGERISTQCHIYHNG